MPVPVDRLRAGAIVAILNFTINLDVGREIFTTARAEDGEAQDDLLPRGIGNIPIPAA